MYVIAGDCLIKLHHNNSSVFIFRKFATGSQMEVLLQRSFSDTCILIDKEGDQPIDIQPKLALMVSNVVSSMAFGKTYVCIPGNSKDRCTYVSLFRFPHIILSMHRLRRYNIAYVIRVLWEALLTISTRMS